MVDHPQGMDNEQYEKDTIGYHHRIASAFFRPESAAVKWLEQKAAESPDGMHERVVMHETQVVALLFKLHKDGLAQQPPAGSTAGGQGAVAP